MKITLTLVVSLFCAYKTIAQSANKADILILFCDTINYDCGYKNLKGDTIIKIGKYAHCFTDTFITYAIVLHDKKGAVVINREEKILYEVFWFDNGPDYIENGFFRIIENGKIGYAEATTGNVIIKPQFDCAFPFENGLAKVSKKCTKKKNGEYTRWISNDWYYIDINGKIVKTTKRKVVATKLSKNKK